MFKDLKEYQEITQIYHDSVNISEEQREINRLFLEEGFTAEEIQYLDENFDEIWENEISILIKEEVSDLTEEQINELVLPAMVGAAAKGIKAVAKKLPTAVKTGIKDVASGAKTVATSAVKKVGNVVKKAAPVLKKIPGIALPAAAVGGVVAGVNKLRNMGKAKREAEANKNKDAEGKTIPSTKEIRANNPNAVGGGNAAGSTDSGEGKTYTSTPTQGTPPPENKTETKPQSKFIRDPKTKTLRKRGTVTARRAENLEKNKLRAQAMAKARIEAKKKAQAEVKEEFDAYDMVLMYLNATEQASTVEEANYIMTEMDQQTIGEIVKQVKEALIDEGMMQQYIKPTFPLLRDKRTGEYMTTDGKPFDLQKFKDDYNKKKEGNMGKDKLKTGGNMGKDKLKTGK